MSGLSAAEKMKILRRKLQEAAASAANHSIAGPSEGSNLDKTLEILKAMKGRKPPWPNVTDETIPVSVIQDRFATVGVILAPEGKKSGPAGFASVALNLFVMSILVAQHRLAFKHAFYILLLNFVLIDWLKGCGLVAFSTTILLDNSIVDPVWRVKIKQINLFILKFCNLGTILNVLLITLNEFCFIKFPLKYHCHITKLRTCIVILLAWLLTAAFTVWTTVTRNQQSSIYVRPCQATFHNISRTVVQTQSNETEKMCFYKDEPDRRLITILMFTLIGFCLACLMVVLVCYTIMFTVIYKIQRQDAQLYASSELSRQLSTHRRSSELSGEIMTQSVTSHGSSGGSVGEERRIKKQVLRRYKYVIVIGSVILVYMLYFLSYITMQILQYMRISHEKGGEIRSQRKYNLILQWSMQVLVGLHAVVQPLCYFRIKEFRRFVHRTFGPCISMERMWRERQGQNNSQILTQYPQNSEGVNCEIYLENGRTSVRKLSEGNNNNRRNGEAVREGGLRKNPNSSSNLKSQATTGVANNNGRKLSVQFAANIDIKHQQPEFQEEGLL